MQRKICRLCCLILCKLTIFCILGKEACYKKNLVLWIFSTKRCSTDFFCDSVCNYRQGKYNVVDIGKYNVVDRRKYLSTSINLTQQSVKRRVFLLRTYKSTNQTLGKQYWCKSSNLLLIKIVCKSRLKLQFQFSSANVFL